MADAGQVAEDFFGSRVGRQDGDFHAAFGEVAEDVALGAAIERDGQRSEFPAVPTEVVDTTGAGDAFAAGYLVGGVELALETAARCVSNLGATP